MRLFGYSGQWRGNGMTYYHLPLARADNLSTLKIYLKH